RKVVMTSPATSLFLQPCGFQGVGLRGITERDSNDLVLPKLEDIDLANINRNAALATRSIPARVADYVRFGIDVPVDHRAEVIPGFAPTKEQGFDGLDASQHLWRIDRAAKIAELHVVVVQGEECVEVAFVEQRGARLNDLHVRLRHRLL